MSSETYKQARERLLRALQAEGWQVKPALKVPQAISQGNAIQLFFKTQAVYLHAHSLHVDIRGLDIQSFLERVYKAALPVTIKCYCECGEDYKLASGETITCNCGATVSRR